MVQRYCSGIGVSSDGRVFAWPDAAQPHAVAELWPCA